ncbi:MAG TPA: hypothetical protein VGU66_17085 [Candidatus Elarobacter sp.]|nr:hypothetical protein [Candidatus Elarobacter sp.]
MARKRESALVAARVLDGVLSRIEDACVGKYLALYNVGIEERPSTL